MTLKKDGHKSLGFSIVGGRNSSRGNCPLFIRSIAPDSIAADDGRLHSGDRLTQINGTTISCVCSPIHTVSFRHPLLLNVVCSLSDIYNVVRVYSLSDSPAKHVLGGEGKGGGEGEKG